MATKEDAFTGGSANNASVLRIEEPTADADPGVGGRKWKRSECENEIKTDLETNIYRVKMNKLLAEAFRDMCQLQLDSDHVVSVNNNTTAPAPLTRPAVSNAKEKTIDNVVDQAKNQRIRFSPENKQLVLGLKNLLGCKTTDNVVQWLIEASRPEIDRLIQKKVQSAENMRTMLQGTVASSSASKKRKRPADQL